jgi:ribosomal protein S27E
MLKTQPVYSPTAPPVRHRFQKQGVARRSVALLCVQCNTVCELVQIRSAKPHTLVRCAVCGHETILGGTPDQVRETFRQQLARQPDER